jgi:hypothetical protein
MAPSAAADERALPGGAGTIRWPYYVELPLVQTESKSDWFDFVVPAGVFDHARLDLGDLRLFDSAGSEIHYALRVREPHYSVQELTTKEFNRAVGENKASELSLDLGAEPPEHNEVEVRLPGENFRRRTVLEGSADGGEWRTLLERKLFYFRTEGKELYQRRLVYPPSRFRYLRLSVAPDPDVDDKPVEIEAAIVFYRVEMPGELVTAAAVVGPREPVRAAGGPGSAWIIELGHDHVPCSRIAVEVADTEFARDYQIEAGGAAGSDEPFVPVTSGQWHRRAGEPQRPLEASFSDQPATRLKLVITDYSNPPLDVRGVRYSAAARQTVFARTTSLAGPLRLVYGNPMAEPPHYDLERNLPARLEPPPERLEAGPQRENPNFEAEPKPLTERWPWLIYLVLGSAGVVLAGIIASLGRAAVKLDDGREAADRTAS